MLDGNTLTILGLGGGVAFGTAEVLLSRLLGAWDWRQSEKARLRRLSPGRRGELNARAMSWRMLPVSLSQ